MSRWQAECPKQDGLYVGVGPDGDLAIIERRTSPVGVRWAVVNGTLHAVHGPRWLMPRLNLPPIPGSTPQDDHA